MNRKRRFRALGISIASLCIVGFIMVSQNVSAIYNVCAGCFGIEIPDPSGGPTFTRHSCLYDIGHAGGCFDVNDGLGCIEFFPGQCD